MLIALLLALEVDLIVIWALVAAVVGRRRWLKRSRENSPERFAYSAEESTG